MVRTASLSWFTLPADLEHPSTSSNKLEGELDSLPSSDPHRRHNATAGSNSKSSTGKVLLGIAALASLALWSSHNSGLAYRVPPQSRCNPFAEPGALFLNVENASSTVWKPFDASCPQSHLLPLVEYILDSETM